MTASSSAVELYPRVAFPEDQGIPDLPRLFDPEWVHDAFRQFNEFESTPHRIRVRQFSHSLGRSAIVSYEVEWHRDDYLPSQQFAAMIERDGAVEVFQYPDDPRLPGLPEVSHPESALGLLSRHVMAVRPRTARVQLVRYRPASRAVLRHSAGRIRLFVRVMRPSAASTFLAAHELMGQSGFVVPRLAGYWPEGGVVWLSEIPGRNLRQQLRRGRMPDPMLLLNGLEPLWSMSPDGHKGRPFNLAGAYRRARRSFRHNVRDSTGAERNLKDATRSLDPFVRDWRPGVIAHNDFYDDQMLVLRDGRIAVVDFEEAGPGDSMLDVGNFLSHLRWASHFGRSREADARGAYHQMFRSAALERFGWSERDLALREAVCLFRVCTNAIRRPRDDWHERLEQGLALVNETIG